MECGYPVPQNRISRSARERQYVEKIKDLEGQLQRIASECQAGTMIRLETPMPGPRFNRSVPLAIDSSYLSIPETSHDRGNTNSAITSELIGEVTDSNSNDFIPRIQLSTLTTYSALGLLSPQSMAGNEDGVVSPQHVSASLANERGFDAKEGSRVTLNTMVS